MSKYISFMMIIIVLLLYFFIVNAKKSIVLIIAGTTIILLFIAFICYNTVFYFYSDYVTIINAEEKEFSIEINNHKENYEYHYEYFSSAVESEDLWKQLCTKYENAFLDEEYKQMVIIQDDNIYTINCYDTSNFLWVKRYHYLLSCNIASVYVSNEETLDVPFPTHVIDDNVTGYSRKIPVTCGFDTLKKYYNFFKNIKITKDTIELYSKIKYIIQYDNAKSEVILSKESSNDT